MSVLNKHRYIDLVCKYCENTFKDFVSNRRTFCSKKCFDEYQRGRKRDLSNKVRGIMAETARKNFSKEIVGYQGLHARVRRERGKAEICCKCGSTKKVEWANISGEYLNTADFMELCKSCHNTYDKIGYKVWEARRRIIYG